MSSETQGQPVVSIDGLTRSFGGSLAVDRVSFAVDPGEIRGLCGHNGAGKSTVIKMLTGQLQPDTGTIAVDGNIVRLRTPQAAQRAGVAVVDQELTVIPALSVAENLRLGDVRAAFFPGRASRLTQRQLLDDLGLDAVQLDDRIADLTLGQRQLVEIARALSRNARLLILDEPTATLGDSEAQLVFTAIRRVAARGCAVIFVSHRLREVIELCDSVTVLRDARLVATTPSSDLTASKLIVQMLGEAPQRPARASAAASSDRPILSVTKLRVPGAVEDFSLDAAPGVVYGIAGQIGSGASDVLRALAGLYPSSLGRISLDGQALSRNDPAGRLQAGIMFVSNDRKSEGLFLEKTVGENLTATRLPSVSRWGFLRPSQDRQQRRQLGDLIGIPASRVAEPVVGFSGGNQQKVFIARTLDRVDARVLLVDEPTRGVDIGGRAAIHELLRSAAAVGMIVIFASTELEELIELGDVVLTMKDGHIVQRHDGDIRGDELMKDMTHDEVASR